MENKVSKKQLIILFILIIVLLVAVGLNVYILAFKKESNSSEQNNTSNSTSAKTENISNETSENTVDNSVNSNSTIDVSNTSSIVIDFTDDVELSELYALMENFSVGIQRVSLDEENLESNTILLFIAKKYFDSHSNKSSLEINTKYAPTVENIHQYLTELTGHNYKDQERIQSYTNYIGYSKSTQSYMFGKDYSTITKESYRCVTLSIIDEKDDGTYTAKADIIRTIDKEETNYEVTFDFTVNQNYTYEKYCIKSLQVKNTSFYPDNTLHLVDTSVEEDENN